ncbi:MAG: acetyl-CoA carboxylase biotin carboxylase subunit [candidate division WOR-3 bacterium]|nr:acetyl-CoA carboxylase biotin carboxylase subunit [candidate division WOR-3 bacterium]
MFKKILIANRGEIAIRVARACREMGIKTVGVYSTVDKESLHLHYCDEAVCIGEPAPLASYLNIPAIIDAAKRTDVEAIHPGYGFLAENPAFAKACEENGIIFIGPSSKALALVGDKVASRITAKKINAPIIPGMEISSAEISEYLLVAQQVGYPVIVKAALGGGGKGMHIASTEKELKETIELSRREAKSAFGDESVYIEKYIEKPRHIEFQVLRDKYGNVVHLCERECSIQRRHQKIIEETPSPALTPELRERMGETAKRIIAAAEYVNAGTVEFLLDQDKNFYFLEVNARVQVEHPITEMVTGYDIVKRQIMIAAGEELDIKQEDVKQRGHAIETRIYAEDPDNNFMPSPGKILFVQEPQGPGIRVDSGIFSGWNVPPHYDPILSKLIVWSESRKDTIARTINALKNYVILGIKTNIPFLKRIIETPQF